MGDSSECIVKDPSYGLSARGGLPIVPLTTAITLKPPNQISLMHKRRFMKTLPCFSQPAFNHTKIFPKDEFMISSFEKVPSVQANTFTQGRKDKCPIGCWLFEFSRHDNLS